MWAKEANAAGSWQGERVVGVREKVRGQRACELAAGVWTEEGLVLRLGQAGSGLALFWAGIGGERSKLDVGA